MPKTNFDLFIENMSEQDLAMMIIQDSFHNTCNYCTECMNPDCDNWCYEHITEWLMKEVDNEKTS